jgi:RHS repeat-associated protein
MALLHVYPSSAWRYRPLWVLEGCLRRFRISARLNGLMDRSTGLIRFGARDYDPGVGRWTSKDPVGFAGGLNFFAYVANAPVKSADPSGRGATGHHYNCKQTQELIEWVREESTAPGIEGWLNVNRNHRGRGQFDFSQREPGATFVIGGKAVNADYFGNFVAGYAGAELGVEGFWVVRAFGVLYDNWNGFDMDADSIPAIDAGAARAWGKEASRGNGDCGCP